MESISEMKKVSVTDIVESSTNPRKEFNLDALLELSESIKETGVLQPVLLRPLPDNKYELVCGARRLRASLMVVAAYKNHFAKDIPAYIREMSDEEVIQAQIIENLQRKDVHPLEEAFGIQQMIEKISVEDIAVKLGKKPKFIYQRLKLTSLTDGWQKLYFKNLIKHSIAMKIALLPEEDQNELYEDSVTQSDIDQNNEINISEWEFRKFKGTLHNAPFDLTDATLDEKAGPCTTCQFNSSVGVLFDDGGKAVCHKIACYKNKCAVSFSIKLMEALSDPAIVLVNNSYSRGGDNDLANIKKQGHTVLMRHDDFSEYDLGEMDSFDEYRNDYLDGDSEATDEEIQSAYDRDLARYNERKAKYDQWIATGKLIKAFVVYGDDKGQYIYVELNKKSTAAAAKKSITSGEPTTLDIDLEIARIETAELRKKQLDNEKIGAELYNALKQTTFCDTEGNFSLNEYIAIAMSVFEKGSYSLRSSMAKELKAKTDYGTESIGVYKKLNSLGGDAIKIINKFIRQFVYESLACNPQNHERNGKSAAMHAVVKDYAPDSVKAIFDAQKVVTDKRVQRVEQRLADLKKKKKELTPKKPAKPTAEKKGKGVKALLTDAPDGDKATPKKAPAAKKATPKKSAAKKK